MPLVPRPSRRSPPWARVAVVRMSVHRCCNKSPLRRWTACLSWQLLCAMMRERPHASPSVEACGAGCAGPMSELGCGARADMPRCPVHHIGERSPRSARGRPHPQTRVLTRRSTDRDRRVPPCPATCAPRMPMDGAWWLRRRRTLGGPMGEGFRPHRIAPAAHRRRIPPRLETPSGDRKHAGVASEALHVRRTAARSILSYAVHRSHATACSVHTSVVDRDGEYWAYVDGNVCGPH